LKPGTIVEVLKTVNGLTLPIKAIIKSSRPYSINLSSKISFLDCGSLASGEQIGNNPSQKDFSSLIERIQNIEKVALTKNAPEEKKSDETKSAKIC